MREVYAGTVFGVLLCGATFIAASLFQMDMVRVFQTFFYIFAKKV